MSGKTEGRHEEQTVYRVIVTNKSRRTIVQGNEYSAI